MSDPATDAKGCYWHYPEVRKAIIHFRFSPITGHSFGKVRFSAVSSASFSPLMLFVGQFAIRSDG
jgi:hypothetical protein